MKRERIDFRIVLIYILQKCFWDTSENVSSIKTCFWKQY